VAAATRVLPRMFMHDEPSRTGRRNLTVVVTGAFSGALGGLLLGSTVGAPGAYAVLVAFGAVGAGVGGLFGQFVGVHMSPDDWDPVEPPRPYVGAHAPDDGELAEPAPLSGLSDR
jgi:hypothetical protein